MIEMWEGQDQNHFSQKQDHSAKGKLTEGRLLGRKWQLFILVSPFLWRVQRGRQGEQWEPEFLVRGWRAGGC